MYIDKKTNKIYSQQQIERKLRKAKERLIDIQQRDFGYNFCEQCKTSNGRLDCSHILSVKKCKESGQIEKIWQLKNMRILCRKCHQEYDKLNLQFKKNKNC